MAEFKLHSQFKPMGDQPEAIRQLSEGVVRGDRDQVLLGITGSGNDVGNLEAYLTRVKENSSCPFVVGFGIKVREDIVLINKLAHGAVVGSAIINAMDVNTSPVETLKNYIEKLVK